MHRAGYHIVGIAETRRRSAGAGLRGDFFAVGAAADEAGRYGCELWLARHRPYAWQEGLRCISSSGTWRSLTRSPRSS
eukprot:2242785-Lingulodinium_polyedra.AAC.1